jgi:hypothetical protein
MPIEPLTHSHFLPSPSYARGREKGDPEKSYSKNNPKKLGILRSGLFHLGKVFSTGICYRPEAKKPEKRKETIVFLIFG